MNIPTESGGRFEDPRESDDTGQGYQQVDFETFPTTFVREGWPDTSEPYDRVVRVTTEFYDSGLHPDIATPEDKARVGHRQLTLEEQVAARLGEYYETFHTGGPDKRMETNCVKFVCDAIGIDIEGEPRWLQAFVSLDKTIKPENEWDETQVVPLGAVMVMGTYEYNEEVRLVPTRVAHAAIGTGTSLVLQVSAKGGHLGFRDQREMVETIRDEIIPDGEQREDVRVFVVPRPMGTPAEQQGQ